MELKYNLYFINSHEALDKRRKFWKHYRRNVLFYIYGSTALSDLGRFSSFLILTTVGRIPWTRDQPAAMPLPTHRTAQTQNKRIP
jgi:hypothetical protein